MHFKDEITIAASAEKIFAFYADVNNWSSWDPDTRSAKLHGDFVSGATATLQPTKGPETEITFTDVQKNKSFIAEGKLPLCAEMCATKALLAGDADVVADIYRQRVVNRGAAAFSQSRLQQKANFMPATSTN